MFYLVFYNIFVLSAFISKHKGPRSGIVDQYFSYPAQHKIEIFLIIIITIINIWYSPCQRRHFNVRLQDIVVESYDQTIKTLFTKWISLSIHFLWFFSINFYYYIRLFLILCLIYIVPKQQKNVIITYWRTFPFPRPSFIFYDIRLLCFLTPIKVTKLYTKTRACATLTNNKCACLLKSSPSPSYYCPNLRVYSSSEKKVQNDSIMPRMCMICNYIIKWCTNLKVFCYVFYMRYLYRCTIKWNKNR